jgi:hypothetical protein
MPRFRKNTLIRSGNPIDAKITSVGKNAVKKAAYREVCSLPVKSLVNL